MRASQRAAKLPPHIRFHTVPRDLQLPVPEGWRCCGPMFAAALRSDARSVFVHHGLWSGEVQNAMGGVVLVSAVAATLFPETPAYWLGPEDIRAWRHRLKPRRPRLVWLSKGQVVRVTMAQCRQGELIVWPVSNAPMAAEARPNSAYQHLRC